MVSSNPERGFDKRDWGDWFVAAQGLITLFFCLGIGWVSNETSRTWITDAVFAPAGLITALLAWRVTRVKGLNLPVLAAWKRITLACLLWWAGDQVLTWYDLSHLEVGYPSVADPFYLAAYVTFLWAFLIFPTSFGSHGEAKRFWLDVLIAFLGGAIAMWYLSGFPATSPPGDLPMDTLYFFCDLFLILAITLATLRRVDDRLRWPMVLLSMALLCTVLNDMESWIYPDAAGGPWERPALLSWFFFSAGAQLQYRMSFRPYRRIVRSLPGGVALPFVAVAAAEIILLIAVYQNWNQHLGGIVIGTTVLTAVVLVRQYLTLHEDWRLLRERAKLESDRRLASLVQNSTDIILVVDRELIIRYATPSLARALRRSLEEVVGKPVSDLFLAKYHGEIDAMLGAVALQPGVYRMEAECVLGDGRNAFVELLSTSLLEEPSVNGIVLTMHDIQQRKVLETQLLHQAFHDPLTNLANRALFADRLRHALAGRHRDPVRIAILMIDLDRFKDINDVFGHAAGDVALKEVSERLVLCFREEDTIARWGGDEFVVLLPKLANSEEIHTIAERFNRALRAPIKVQDRSMLLTASIGIVVASAEVDLSEELMRHADLALYLAKQKGGARYEVFNPDMYPSIHAAIVDRLELGADLRRALDHQELFLEFQPILNLRKRTIVGAEALIRWNHPERGRIEPSQFIPLAEETGAIVTVGQHVFKQCCELLADWSQQGSPHSHFFLSLNVSGRQLQDQGLADSVKEILAQTKIDPGRLVLEITETVLMTGFNQAREQISQLKRLGVKLAIDDFGTGYSSLSYLQDSPVDIIKIDKTFVQKGATNLLRGILELSRVMGVDVVAEGVETEEQARVLESLDCEFAQGFLFAESLGLRDLYEYISLKSSAPVQAEQNTS